MAFVLVPAGRFVMGSPDTEAGREPQETRHEVTLSQPFWLGAYEVTQGQWQAVMGWNRSTFRGATRPVEQVNWLEIQEFLRRRPAPYPIVFDDGEVGGLYKVVALPHMVVVGRDGGIRKVFWGVTSKTELAEAFAQALN